MKTKILITITILTLTTLQFCKGGVDSVLVGKWTSCIETSYIYDGKTTTTSQKPVVDASIEKVDIKYNVKILGRALPADANGDELMGTIMGAKLFKAKLVSNELVIETSSGGDPFKESVRCKTKSK